MKLSLKKLAAVILLMTAISCSKQPLGSPSAAKIQTQDNATQKTAGHYIGERFGGGIIFAMNSAGTHGLIADTVDLPPDSWNDGPYITTGATGTAIGTGPSNTRKIISSQGTSGTYAALECAQSKRSGYTDWFLPSKDELYQLFKKKRVIGVFAYSYYWSSSESDSVDAWNQLFYGGGYQEYGPKSGQLAVRAVRAF